MTPTSPAPIRSPGRFACAPLLGIDPPVLVGFAEMTWLSTLLRRSTRRGESTPS